MNNKNKCAQTFFIVSMDKLCSKFGYFFVLNVFHLKNNINSFEIAEFCTHKKWNLDNILLKQFGLPHFHPILFLLTIFECKNVGVQMQTKYQITKSSQLREMYTFLVTRNVIIWFGKDTHFQFTLHSSTTPP